MKSKEHKLLHSVNLTIIKVNMGIINLGNIFTATEFSGTEEISVYIGPYTELYKCTDLH